MRAHSRTVLVFSLISLCSMTILIGCGNSSNSTTKSSPLHPTATATLAPGTVFIYTSSAKAYSIAYPGAWLKMPMMNTANPDAVAFFSTDQQDIMAVVPLVYQIAAADYGTPVKAILSNIGATNITITPTVQSQGAWSTETGTMTYQKNS